LRVPLIPTPRRDHPIPCLKEGKSALPRTAGTVSFLFMHVLHREERTMAAKRKHAEKNLLYSGTEQSARLASYGAHLQLGAFRGRGGRFVDRRKESSRMECRGRVPRP
jgi:hypothetical protein